MVKPFTCAMYERLSWVVYRYSESDEEQQPSCCYWYGKPGRWFKYYTDCRWWGTALADARSSAGMKVTIEQDVTGSLCFKSEEIGLYIVYSTVVFFVVYIFLRNIRSTLIPSVAVPNWHCGTFFFLWVFGFSVNLLTLSALLLAVRWIDDTHRGRWGCTCKLDLGYKSAMTAAIDAMNEISGAIISITLVISGVFVPVSFMGGTHSGTFYRRFGVTMAVSIVISTLERFIVSCALCYLLEAT